MTRAALLPALALAVAGACAGPRARSPLEGRPQRHSLSCEARAACDLLAFHGRPVDEDAFLSRLSRSDNPDLGFVGDPDGETGGLPPAAYGVHAPPVAETLRAFGLHAEAVRDRDLGWLRAELDAGRPVLLWVTAGLEPASPVVLRDTTGQAFEAVRGEHAVLALRRRGSRVTILDPAHGEEREVDERTLLASWQAFRCAAERASGGGGVRGGPR